uniref:LRRCT domain-containing protein n=1 Tax=Fundulus heteroclitus TaxID=8078 RepID=A0A3Q2NPT7_FUNHE
MESPAKTCQPGCECRGALKFAVCQGAGLAQLPVRAPASTELLDLSHNLISVVPRRGFAGTRKLRVLLLQSNNISRVEDGGFAQLEFLQKLDLSWNRVAALAEGFSLGLASLRELQLSHNRLTSLDARSFLHLDGLQRLNLSDNGLRTVQARSFASMSGLRQLHLQRNRLTSLRSGAFTMLRSLEVLDLSGNRLQEMELATLLSVRTYGTHVLLRGNPWNCDCELQRVFRKLRSVQRLFLDDYLNLTCSEPAVLRAHRLTEVDSQLCIAETVTGFAGSVAVLAASLAADARFGTGGFSGLTSRCCSHNKREAKRRKALISLRNSSMDTSPRV